eukprot:2367479-Pleurochrysis_carterae.AAC.1
MLRFPGRAPASASALPKLPAPLSTVVAALLVDWGVESDEDSDSDEFCGWRVGSRADTKQVSTSDASASAASPRRKSAGSSLNGCSLQ